MCIVCGPNAAHLLRAIASRSTPARPRLSAQAVAPRVVPALDPASQADLTGPADVILRGGPILTMSGVSAEAVAMRAGRIQFVGSEADALAHRGRLTRVVDLQGRALLPGFINAHWHMPFTLLCEWIDISSASSTTAILSLLAQAARGTPAGEWIVLGANVGMAPMLPAVGALDATARLHPVLITDADGTIVTGNSLAKDGDGRRFPAHISALLPRFAVSADLIRRRLAALLQQTAAVGVTCLRVCGLGTLAGADDFDMMRTAAANGSPLRLRATLDAALPSEWQALHLTAGSGDDMFRIDTLSAWPGTVAHLAATLRNARDAGWSVTVHATDAAQLRSALDGFKQSGAVFDHRSGIECRHLPEPPRLAAIRRLGLSLGLTGDDRPDFSTLDGIPVSLGLDAALGPSAPLRMASSAVAGGQNPMQALAAVTIGAARRCGVGGILGSLERGKYGDVVFLDRDPRTVADLASLRCMATWVNGREAFGTG